MSVPSEITPFVQTIQSAEIAQGGMIAVEINGCKIVIFNNAGSFYALDRCCGHMNAPLEMDTLQRAPIPFLNRYDTMITMETVSRQSIADEDQFVAELHQLGITYLSNRLITLPNSPRSPEKLIADAIKQPSSRVRTAVIALFLLHPGYAEYVPTALSLLNENQRQLLKLFYTAAVHLQRLYQSDLIAIIGSELMGLPDRFGEDLGISSTLSPKDAIQQLGIKHQQITRSLTNWSGTYKNVVHHLIRYKQRESQWNQSPHKPSSNF